jgi:hypothetical protein
MYSRVVLYKGTPANKSKQDTGRVKNGYRQSKKQVPASMFLTRAYASRRRWLPKEIRAEHINLKIPNFIYEFFALNKSSTFISLP